MSDCPTLHTERLTLRPFEDSDLDAYAAIVTSEEVRLALHLPDAFSRSDAWRGMALWRGQWALRGTGHWAVVEIETGQLVGRAGLNRPELAGWPGIEVGWTIDPRHWGRGFATEAGARSIEYAFDEIGAAEVFSLILAENSRSAAVATRLSFTLTDTQFLPHFSDAPLDIWRLTREQWEPRGPAS
jgi:RimJ/RimL family protein N-acetyltransferase